MEPGGKPKLVREDAGAYLLQRAWSGNVRELGNVIGKAALMASDVVLTREAFFFLEDTPEYISTDTQTFEVPKGLRLDALRSAVEREAIKCTLAECGGNVSMAAKKLGVECSSFYKKMGHHGLMAKRRAGSVD